MITRVWTKMAVAAAAILIAGCGGGGGSSAGGSTVPAPPPQAASGGKMVLSIPNTTGGQSAGKRSISPAASSISIVVVNGTTSLAPQLADISPSSPLCTVTSSGRTCTIPVSAPQGTDTFNITIFDGAGGTGHQLATGSAQTTVVPGAPFSVNITLNGIISSLSFYIPVDPSQDYPGPKAGEAGSVIGTVVAKDASGNIIVGPYATPVSLASSNATIAVSPASLAQSGPVTYTYNGGLTASTLTATAGSVSASVTIAPQSNIVTYDTPTINPYRFILGSDGKFYINEFGPEGVVNGATGLVGGLGPGKVARFDPASGAFTGEVPNGQSPIGIAFSPDGTLWTSSVLDNNLEGAVGRITGFSTYTAFTPPTNPLARVRDIVLGPDGNMWFTEMRGGQFNPVAKIAKFAPATPGTMTEFPLAAGARNQGGLLSGPDGNLWVTDSGNLAIAKVTTAGVATEFTIPGANPSNPMNFPRYLASGSDGNIYMSDLGTQAPIAPGSAIWKINPSTGAMTATSIPPNVAPDDIRSGPTGKLYFTDLNELGIGVLDTASGTGTVYPLYASCLSSGGIAPGAVNAGPDGSLWFTTTPCGLAPATVSSKLGHLLLAPGWRLFPVDRTINLSVAGSNQQLLGIAESGSTTFTVTSSAPSIVSVTAINSHNWNLTALAPGTATITVSDGTLSVTRTVVVTTATATVSSTNRRTP